MVLTFLLLAAGSEAMAQQVAAGAEEPLVIVAENRTAAAEAAGGAPRADDRVRPGDVIRYTLRFTNPADGPVRNIVLRNPLPEGLRFVGGSAEASRDDMRLEYSIDGGRSWSARPMVEVVENGRTVRRAAPPEMYTDVRWTVEGAVQPGVRVVALFDARMPTQPLGAPTHGDARSED